MSAAEETKAMATTQSMSPMEIQAANAVNQSEIVASDVLVPRLLLMQGTSPFVTGRKAQLGDMVRSTTGEILGNPDKPVDLIPLKMVNSWIMFETAKSAGTTQPAFRGQEPRGAVRNAQGIITGSNEDLPWDYTENGKEMFRRKAITLYALVPSDVEKYNKELQTALETGEAPDLTKTVLPIVLTFQSTSFKHAGKKCASFFNSVRVNAAKMSGKMTIAPFQYMLTLSCREEKKGTNVWYVYDFTGNPRAVKDEAVRSEAATWAMMINAGQVRTDDSGEVAEESSSSVGGGASEMEV
jgi:hypothetical protein